MRTFARWILISLSIGLGLGRELRAIEISGTLDTEDFFERNVRPVLVANCLKCHGAVKASGGLRLDSREAILKGGESGPAIIVGNPSQSLLIRAIGHDESLKMPPDKLLPTATQAAFAAWISSGASWPKSATSQQRPPLDGQRHWAFDPLLNTTPPLDSTGWAEGPVDRFIARGLKAHGLHPVAQASKRTLVRRAFFDLIGLPPSPMRVEAYLMDDRPDAYDRLIDELLASPHYGERWGRYWLDLARYADTAGDNSDYPIPEAYLYRDYVIDALNADVPYDRFIHEQLAGDILAAEGLPTDYARCVIATGFVAQAKRFGTFKLEDLHQIIEDTLNTTGQVVLGLSLRCARCHDHKYDPITSRDYYALYGFFASTKYPFAGAEENKKPSDFAPLLPPRELKVREAKLAEEATRAKKAPNPLVIPVSYAVQEGIPTDVKFQIGGNPHELGRVVPRGVPKILDPRGIVAIPKGSSGRLQLARWLTQGPAQSLTARVMVNRIWQHHFGKPIVPTPSDFGLRGSPPTHPELLDWLARAFINSGWSIKAMHRMIMLSKTYRLASESDSYNAKIDTGNEWYWRYNKRPLDAEALRDAMLVLAGLLDRSRPGPHPFPDRGSWRFTAHHQFKAAYVSNHRSVYLMVQRLHPHPYLTLFNSPDTSLSTSIRDEGFLPLQALFLLNSPFVHEQAERFARMLIEKEPNRAIRVHSAYLSAFGRPPTPKEESQALAYLTRYEKLLADEGVPSIRWTLDSWSSLARTILGSNEFLCLD